MSAPKVYDPYARIRTGDIRPLSPWKAIALYLWTISWLLAVLGVFIGVTK